jgi:hypothetical protein
MTEYLALPTAVSSASDARRTPGHTPPAQSAPTSAAQPNAASDQGLTLAHFSAQHKRFLWTKGCLYGLFRGCVGGDRGY